MNLMTPEILDKLKVFIKNNQVSRFYWMKEWRIIRKIRKQIDNKECQRCKRNGIYSPADMVHHKKEVRFFPELALDLDNTESLCNACHNREHPEKLNRYQKKRNLTTKNVGKILFYPPGQTKLLFYGGV